MTLPGPKQRRFNNPGAIINAFNLALNKARNSY
jgi:hypothetical protein